MKVKLVRDDEGTDKRGNKGLGKKGTVLEGPEVWRHAFPVKGAKAIAADAEAQARIQQDIDGVGDPQTRDRLTREMQARGTLAGGANVADEPIRETQRTAHHDKP